MRLLHHHPLCAFSRVARLVLAEKKLEFSMKMVEPDPPPQDFFPFNPAPDHPVMVDNNHTITGIDAVTEYLEETYPEIPLLPGHTVARAEIRRLTAWFNGRFYDEVTHKLVGEKLFKRLLVPQQEPDSRKIRAAYQAIHRHMAMIGVLSEQNTWLAGDSFSLADITAAAQISCIDYGGDVPWDQHPSVKDWYARVKSRPSFRPLLADHVPGLPPARHYAILDF